MRLGRCYAEGISVERDEAKAIKLYRVAAKPPHELPLAQYSLALLLSKGAGVPADKVDGARVEAVRILRLLAARGHVGSLCRLGCLAEQGKGMSCDKAKAAHCYRRAVEENDPLALLCMGVFLEKGRGGLRQNAAQYYECAAAGMGAAHGTQDPVERAHELLSTEQEDWWSLSEDLSEGVRCLVMADRLGYTRRLPTPS